MSFGVCGFGFFSSDAAQPPGYCVCGVKGHPGGQSDGQGHGVGYVTVQGNHRRGGGEVQEEHALNKSRGGSGQLSMWPNGVRVLGLDPAL